MGNCRSAMPRRSSKVDNVDNVTYLETPSPSDRRNEAEQQLEGAVREQMPPSSCDSKDVADSNIVIVKNGNETKPSNEVSKNDGVISVVYLFSSPLDGSFKLLNANDEIERLKRTLRQVTTTAKVAVSFEALVGTSYNRLETLKNRPTILYISSHCDLTSEALLMEDTAGIHQKWTSGRIQGYFKTSAGVANRQRPIQCAIIGVCWSEKFAKLFMEHGNIRHVVTVKESEEVSDSAMSAFVRLFLENVLQNKPVQCSVDAARLILGDDSKFSAEADKFLLYQQEGFTEETLSVGSDSARNVGLVNNIGPTCQLICKDVPLKYVSEGDVLVLQRLHSFLSHNSRALAVVQAPRGHGSTTLATRLAHHLAPRRVFRGIYYIPLEAYIQEKGIEYCQERDIVHCAVESLKKRIPGLESCISFEDLIAAVTENLTGDHSGAEAERDKSSTRMLFIFDGCCVGGQSSSPNDMNCQLRTTQVANLISRLLTVAENVSVLAVCHEEVAFPLKEDGIIQTTLALEKMSDLNIARLLLRDAARKIQFQDYITTQQYQDEINVGNPTELEKAKRAEEIFSRSPIVKELQGMPAAARIFSRHIKQKSLMEVDYYVELSRKSVALARNSKQLDRQKLSECCNSVASRGNAPLSQHQFYQRAAGTNCSNARSMCTSNYVSLNEISDHWNSCPPIDIDYKSTRAKDGATAHRSHIEKWSELCLPDNISEASTQSSDSDNFHWIFHDTLRIHGVSSPHLLDREGFSDLALTRQGDQLVFDGTKFRRVCNDLLYLAEVYPELFGTSIALVHYFTSFVAEQRLNGKDLRPGNCLFRLCDNGSGQLILSWFELEGGEYFMVNANISVEKGPKFTTGDKEYSDLNSLIRESGGGSLRYLYPNIPIGGNKDLESLRGWICSESI